MKIIKVILASVILLLMGIRAYPITVEEAKPVFTEIGILCNMFNAYCTVSSVPDSHLFAQTQFNGRIIISTGLLEKLNINQVRAVLYHEAGHAVLKHPEKTYKYYTECMPNGCSDNIYMAVRKEYELQADRFAVLVLKYTKQKETLSEALYIITPIEELNTVHPSHPSTSYRIEQIQRIYYGY